MQFIRRMLRTRLRILMRRIPIRVRLIRAYPSGISAEVCSRRRRQGMIHPSVRCRP
jgi:hypothetical protein